MTKDEKAEDYDRLQYEFTQISQDLKSEKRANKKLQEQLLLHNVSQQRELLNAYSKYLEKQECRGFYCYIDDFIELNSI